jgi:hypothetical protein
VGISFFAILINHSFEAPAFVNEAGTKGYHFQELAKFNSLFPVQTFLAGNTSHSLGKLLLERHLSVAFPYLLALCVFVLFLAALWKVWLAYLKEDDALRSSTLLLTSLIVGTASVLLLIYLTLTRPVQKNDVLDNWTFVQEGRYFATIWITILASFLFVLLRQKGRLQKIVLYFLLAISAINIPYYFYNKAVEIRKNSSYFVTGTRKLFFLQYPENPETRDSIISGYEALGHTIGELTKKNGIRPIYMSADRSERIAVLEGAVFGRLDPLDKHLFGSRTQSIIFKISANDPYPNGWLKTTVQESRYKPFYSGIIGDLYVFTVPARADFESAGNQLLHK